MGSKNMKCEKYSELENLRAIENVFWRPDPFIVHQESQPESPFITNCPRKLPRTHQLFITPPNLKAGPHKQNINLDSYIRSGETNSVHDRKLQHVDTLNRELDIRLPISSEINKGFISTLDYRPEFSHLMKSSSPSSKPEQTCPFHREL